MRIFSSIRLAMRTLIVLVVCLTGICTPAFAAPKDAVASQGTGPWVWAYMIVVLVLALGLIVVCKSSGRRDRSKPESYEQHKKNMLD